MITEIQLPVAELKAVLPGLSKVIPKRATLPILGCVRLDRNETGQVSLQVTDLEDTVTARFKEMIPGPQTSVLVPFEALVKAVKNSSPSQNVVVLAEGEKSVKLRTFIGSSPVDQPVDVPEIKEWPMIPVIKQTGIMVDKHLKTALREALQCSSVDESRLTLNSAFLDVEDKNAHYVVSTNGRMLFSANSFNLELKQSLIIPRRKFLGWPGWWEEENCRLSFVAGEDKPDSKTDGWVQFSTDRWTFITRQIPVQYPNWKQIIPTNEAKTVIKLSQAAVDDLLAVLPKLPGKDEPNSPVTLVVAKHHLQIQGKGKSDGKPTSIPVDGALITGEDVSVCLNREYLSKALQFGLGDILIRDSTTPVVCQSNGKRIIVAPLNTDQPPTPVPPTPTPETPEPESTPMNKTIPATPETLTPESAIKKVTDQIEQIKDTLKTVISEFNDVLASLKLAEKEKKATEKEIESIRATLKTIQNVKI